MSRLTSVEVCVIIAFLALSALVGCPSILGIEEGVLLDEDAGHTNDVDAPDASKITDAPDAGEITDAGEISDAREITDAPTTDGSVDALTPQCQGALVACGGVCVDLSLDTDHCGACGRRCVDGSCSDGLCPTTVVLQTGVAKPSLPSLVVDDTSIFFSRNVDAVHDDVVRANLNGSGVVVVSDKSTPLMLSSRILVTDADVFWGSNVGGSAIFRSPKVIPSPETHALLGTALNTITLDVGELFVGVSKGIAPSTVVRAATTPSPSLQTLGQIAVADVCDIAANSSVVVASSRKAGVLVKWARSGGASEVLATGFFDPRRVVLDAQNAYVLDAGDPSNKANGSIVKIALATGAKTTLVTDLVSPYDLVRSDDHLYVTTSGAVARVPTSGEPKLLLAREALEYQGVAVHGDYVYWTSRGQVLSSASAIWRSTK